MAKPTLPKHPSRSDLQAQTSALRANGLDTEGYQRLSRISIWLAAAGFTVAFALSVVVLIQASEAVHTRNYITTTQGTVSPLPLLHRGPAHE